MIYLEMFDEEFIDDIDPIDKWIRDNKADVKISNSAQQQVQQLDSQNDFRDDENE